MGVRALDLLRAGRRLRAQFCYAPPQKNTKGASPPPGNIDIGRPGWLRWMDWRQAGVPARCACIVANAYAGELLFVIVNYLMQSAAGHHSAILSAAHGGRHRLLGFVASRGIGSRPRACTIEYLTRAQRRPRYIGVGLLPLHTLQLLCYI